jgi:hypothetical protein
MALHRRLVGAVPLANACIAWIIHAWMIQATALLLRDVDRYPLLKYGVAVAAWGPEGQ